MQIYSANQKGPLKVSGFIDPDDQTNVIVFWGSPLWTANTVYRAGDLARPSSDNGYYYECSTNGKSAATQPIWQQTDDTVSGTAVFTAVPWDLWLMPDETIVDSSWTTDDATVILTNPSHADYKSMITITAVSDTSAEFTLTNQVTKTNGEKLSRSFKYKTNQQ